MSSLQANSQFRQGSTGFPAAQPGASKAPTGFTGAQPATSGNSTSANTGVKTYNLDGITITIDPAKVASDRAMTRAKNRMNSYFAAETSAKAIRERRATQGDNAPPLTHSQQFLLDSFPENPPTRDVKPNPELQQRIQQLMMN